MFAWLGCCSASSSATFSERSVDGGFLVCLWPRRATSRLALRCAIERGWLPDASPPPAKACPGSVTARIPSVCSGLVRRCCSDSGRCPSAARGAVPTVLPTELCATAPDAQSGLPGRSRAALPAWGQPGWRAPRPPRRGGYDAKRGIGSFPSRSAGLGALCGGHRSGRPAAAVRRCSSRLPPGGYRSVRGVARRFRELGGGVSSRGRSPRFCSLHALARHFHGQVCDRGTRAAFDWLDAYWAGPTPDGSMVCHNSPQGDAGATLGCWFQSHGARCWRSWQTRRMFAARPVRVPAQSLATAHVSELAHGGARLSVTPAGLHVWARTSDAETVGSRGSNGPWRRRSA